MSEAQPQLEYAPGAPVRRRRRLWRVVAAIIVIVSAVAMWTYAPTMIVRARQIYWQRQCLKFEPPPGSVMFEILPPGSPKPLVEEPLIDWGSPEVVAARPALVMSSRSMGIVPADVLATKGPKCLLRLGQAHAVTLSEGPVLFCHERTSPGGNRRLVTAVLPTYGVPDFIMGDVLADHIETTAFPVIKGYGQTRPGRTSGGLIAHSGPALPPPRRIFAGVPDPYDPSRFSIEYEWPDGVRGFLDGLLRDDDIVTLTIRPGPGDVPSAFKRGLHDRDNQ